MAWRSPIPPHQAETLRQWSANSSRAAAMSVRSRLRRRRTTQSRGKPGGTNRRNDSRTMRLMTLRRAAERQMRFGTTRPRRLQAGCGSTASALRQRMSKKGPLARGRAARASRNTADAAIRRQRRRPAGAGLVVTPSDSDGETGATLCTACADDRGAAAAAHADEEAVGALALDDGRLECALHLCSSALSLTGWRWSWIDRRGQGCMTEPAII